jgi:hypothetical protein
MYRHCATRKSSGKFVQTSHTELTEIHLISEMKHTDWRFWIIPNTVQDLNKTRPDAVMHTSQKHCCLRWCVRKHLGKISFFLVIKPVPNSYIQSTFPTIFLCLDAILVHDFVSAPQTNVESHYPRTITSVSRHGARSSFVIVIHSPGYPKYVL